MGPRKRRSRAVVPPSAAPADPFGRDLLDPIRGERADRNVIECGPGRGWWHIVPAVLALEQENGRLISSHDGARAEIPASAPSADAVARHLGDGIVKRVSGRHVEKVIGPRKTQQYENVEF